VDDVLDLEDVSGIDEISHFKDGCRVGEVTPVDDCREKNDAGVSIWDDVRGDKKVNRGNWRKRDDEDEDEDEVEEAGMELPTEEEEVVRMLPWLADANRVTSKTESECETRIGDIGPAADTDVVGGEAESKIDVERNEQFAGEQKYRAGRRQDSSDEETGRVGEGEFVDEDNDAKMARMMAEEEEEQRRLAEEEDARMARMLSEQEEAAAVGMSTSPEEARKRFTYLGFAFLFSLSECTFVFFHVFLGRVSPRSMTHFYSKLQPTDLDALLRLDGACICGS